MDSIRNKYIRGTAQVRRFGDKLVKGVELKIVWRRAEERCWVYLGQDAKDRAATQEEMRTTKAEV